MGTPRTMTKAGGRAGREPRLRPELHTGRGAVQTEPQVDLPVTCLCHSLARLTSLVLVFCFVFYVFITQHGVPTSHPEVNSCTRFQLSRPGPPTRAYSWCLLWGHPGAGRGTRVLCSPGKAVGLVTVVRRMGTYGRSGSKGPTGPSEAHPALGFF